MTETKYFHFNKKEKIEFLLTVRFVQILQHKLQYRRKHNFLFKAPQLCFLSNSLKMISDHVFGHMWPCVLSVRS